jgi:2,5-diketo-D-gluconate reductase B
MQEFIKTKYLTIPALGLGTYKLTGDQGVESIKTALKIGYRHIDTAQFYNNEEEVGRAIKESGVDRHAIFLTTKIWPENLKKDDVQKSFAESLKKLQTDYVDLLLIHWPNPQVELKETLDAMQALKDAGQVKAIGVSNFPVALMKQAVEELKFEIACNQVEYHVMLNQKPVLDYTTTHDMVMTAYSPLGQGQLTQNETIKKIADKYKKTPGQIALRWLIQQNHVAAIPKASSEEHLRANFEIFDFKLDDEDLKALQELNGDNRLVNPDIAPEWDQAA